MDDRGTNRNGPIARRRLLRDAGSVGAVALAAGCTADDDVDPGSSGEGEHDEATTGDDSGDRSADGDAGPADDGGGDEIADGDPDADAPIEDRVRTAFDDAIRTYVDDRGIPTGAVGVASEGEVVIQRGYGPAERDGDSEVDPDALFRIASISKAITDAAVRTLVRDDELAFDDEVIPMLDVEPPEGFPDERVLEVTVEHLMNHQGGWADPPTADPMFDPFSVADALDLEKPPTKRDFARHLLDRPLDFEPGTDAAYSNFGYVLLGLAIEAVSGREYVEYVNEAVLDPKGIDPVHLARSRPVDRPENEVWYDSPEACPDAVALDPDSTVRCADGGFPIEALDAAGGLVASTGTLLDFLDAYWLTGEPRDAPAPEGEYRYFGLLTGTTTAVQQRPDGVDIAVLFNGRVGNPATVLEATDRVIGDVEGWP